MRTGAGIIRGLGHRRPSGEDLLQRMSTQTGMVKLHQIRTDLTSSNRNVRIVMKKIKILLPALIIVSALLISACGGSAQTSSSPTATTTVKVSPTTPPTPSPTPKPQIAHYGQTADQILHGLKAHGLHIGASFTYTADNDVNKLLGRPGQYNGKINFKDTRISSTNQGANISVSDGGSIEVFANATDAQHRFAYIQAISTSGNALFAEYEYLDGVAILRISSQLTPSQASAYKAALKALP